MLRDRLDAKLVMDVRVPEEHSTTRVFTCHCVHVFMCMYKLDLAH